MRAATHTCASSHAIAQNALDSMGPVSPQSRQRGSNAWISMMSTLAIEVWCAAPPTSGGATRMCGGLGWRPGAGLETRRAARGARPPAVGCRLDAAAGAQAHAARLCEADFGPERLRHPARQQAAEDPASGA